MTVSERLNAAADRLKALDKAATAGQWPVRRVSAPGPGRFAADVERFRVGDIAVVGQREDADLIATLRPLALPIAAWLRDEARIFGVQVKREGDHDWHDDAEGGCGHYRSPAPLGAYCICFARPIAVADAILGGAA